jgi:hemoglobin
MRTLWVSSVAGGPFQYTATKPGSTPVGLEAAHRELKISPAEFDDVAAELGRTLQGEVTAGSVAAGTKGH